MAMTPQTYSINALATELGRDRRTVSRALSDTPPAEVRGREKRWRLRDAIAALQRSERRGYGRPLPTRRSELAREILRDFMIRQQALVPWLSPALVTLTEYEESIGLDHESGEIIDWMLWGFPIEPPAEGESVARVSPAHGELWRLTFGALIESLGGDGKALEIGREARRLADLPQVTE